MFDEVEFDEALTREAEKQSMFKSYDLKYYIMVLAFIGLGAFVITKFDK